jgi:hypothetical protein
MSMPDSMSLPACAFPSKRSHKQWHTAAFTNPMCRPEPGISMPDLRLFYHQGWSIDRGSLPEAVMVASMPPLLYNSIGLAAAPEGSYLLG